jgi:hypothetical protein
MKYASLLVVIALTLACAFLVAACASSKSGRTSQAPTTDREDSGAASGARAESRDTFDETRRMIEEARAMGLPEGNYRVGVENVWLSESDASSIGALFGYRGNRAAAQVGSPTVNPGFRFAIGGRGFQASLAATLSSTKNSQRSNQFLVTVADSPAYLDVGQVRYGIPINLGPRRGVLIVRQGQFVGSSLQVVVSPAGPGVVSVTLTPRFTQSGTPDGNLQLTEMSTTVQVPLGQPLLIGSSDQSSDSVASALLSRTSSSVRQQGVIVLTVTGG